MNALRLGLVLAIGASGAWAQPLTARRPWEPNLNSPVLSRHALIAEAVSAAPPKISQDATVKNWDGSLLRQGREDYTCFPTPTELRERGESAPMCLDKVWLAWHQAWSNQEPFRAERVGVAYVLSAQASSSNIDPYATEPTSDKEWYFQGPHLLVLLPDPAHMEAVPTHPKNGGPFVRWRNTPYAHLVVPVERSLLGP